MQAHRSATRVNDRPLVLASVLKRAINTRVKVSVIIASLSSPMLLGPRANGTNPCLSRSHIYGISSNLAVPCPPKAPARLLDIDYSDKSSPVLANARLLRGTPPLEESCICRVLRASALAAE
jgi:hypothetical protein